MGEIYIYIYITEWSQTFRPNSIIHRNLCLMDQNAMPKILYFEMKHIFSFSVTVLGCYTHERLSWLIFRDKESRKSTRETAHMQSCLLLGSRQLEVTLSIQSRRERSVVQSPWDSIRSFIRRHPGDAVFRLLWGQFPTEFIHQNIRLESHERIKLLMDYVRYLNVV